MSTSLAEKYRPETLKDLIGNEGTVRKLEAMLKRKEIPHAVLLTGPSGCGKTTVARIIATHLNCSKFDFVEQNTADFRGIDSVRDIIAQMRLLPMSGAVRVWLLDECHQLSKDAQTALLKALENPPKHVYFVLATTEPEKLLPTMKTRLPPFVLQSLTDAEMETMLNAVLEAEDASLSDEAMGQIIQDSMGSGRMALSILETVINLPEKEMAAAAKQQSVIQNEAIELCRALFAKRPWKEIAAILSGLKGEPEQVRRAVMGYMTAILLKKDDAKAYDVLASFRQDFFTSGKAGLVIAAYEATH